MPKKTNAAAEKASPEETIRLKSPAPFIGFGTTSETYSAEYEESFAVVRLLTYPTGPKPRVQSIVQVFESATGASALLTALEEGVISESYPGVLGVEYRIVPFKSRRGGKDNARA